MPFLNSFTARLFVSLSSPYRCIESLIPSGVFGTQSVLNKYLQYESLKKKIIHKLINESLQ